MKKKNIFHFRYEMSIEKKKVLKEMFLTDKTNKDKYIFWIESKIVSNICHQSRSDVFLGKIK